MKRPQLPTISGRGRAMSDMLTIRVIRAAPDIEFPGPVCREVYFPYLEVEATCNAPGFARTRKLTLRCLVDGVNDLAATSDAFIVDDIKVKASAVVESCIDIARARRTARRYLFHHLGRRAKAILNFGLELHAAKPVYKRFLVVESDAGPLLVDSTTGGTYPLPAAAEA